MSDELAVLSMSCPSPRCLACPINTVVGTSTELLKDCVAVVKVDVSEVAVVTETQQHVI